MRRSRTAGFTLLEIVLLVVVLGVIAAITFPQFKRMVYQSREGRTKSNLGDLRGALAIYYSDNFGLYPSDEGTPETRLATTLVPQYIKAIPYVAAFVAEETEHRPRSFRWHRRLVILDTRRFCGCELCGDGHEGEARFGMVDPLKIIDLGVELPPKQLILVVDDEPSLQSLVFDTLSGEYRIIPAYNGREGIQKAMNSKPDLILMDLSMPDLNGYEAIRILKDTPDTKNIPIVMITAQDFDPSTVQMIKSEPNVVGFINKPFRPKGLRETVRMAISRQL
jgi:CheY-like chemotaxis protein/Tfp pilus assembly protein PilE